MLKELNDGLDADDEEVDCDPCIQSQRGSFLDLGLQLGIWIWTWGCLSSQRNVQAGLPRQSIKTRPRAYLAS